MLYLLPIAAAVGVIAAIGVVVIAAQQNQHNQASRYSPDENYVPTPRPLAPCADCHGPLYEYNGTRLSCGHTMHFTCLQNRRRNMREYLHGDMCCPICFPDNQVARRRHNGSTNRSPQPKTCAMCLALIGDNLYTKLECQTHIVHDTCWAEMQECNMTDCIICSPKQAPEQVTSSTNRSPQPKKCVMCPNLIRDDLYTKLECQTHIVHNTCWANMQKCNMTDCIICSPKQAPEQVTSSTNRSPQPKKCVMCPNLIRDDLYTKLECQTHIVHNTCWANMQKCNMTDCIICSPKQAPEQVTSLTTRSSGIRECANCEEPIADDSFKKLQCQKHRVHNTCWERMVESNLTGCSTCYEEGLKVEYDN